jgi:hypothetical protein
LKDNGERLKIFETQKKKRSKVMKLSDLTASDFDEILEDILTERKQPVPQKVRVKEQDALISFSEAPDCSNYSFVY